MTNTHQYNQKLAQNYDEINYTSNVFSSSQPIRLHALAKMKGLDPVPLETARVLEIGCSFGGNILPFAIRFPNSEVVGIDLSERQIEAGKQMINLIGIKNISLMAGDISNTQFDKKFDYIICHGVFSWVPEFVRQAILSCIQNYLSPNGIAYISYNTYPGWKGKDIVKDLMLFGSNPELPISERLEQSLALLEFTGNVLEGYQGNFYQYMKEKLAEIKTYPAFYLSHEYFEEYHHPLYFREFVESINKYDLAYVAESSVPAILPKFIFKEKEQYQQVCEYFNYQLEGIEQYIDFIANRPFRASVITHRQNLVGHNITNHIEQYGNCHSFYDIYFYHSIKFIEGNDDQQAHWSDEKGMTFENTPLNRELFTYLSKQKGLCKVANVFEALKNSPVYDQSYLEEIIWMLIHLNGTLLSYYPVILKKAGQKPHIPEAIRNYLQVVFANPNITCYSNVYFEVININPTTAYFSKYFDGTRNMKALVQQFRQCLENDDLNLINNEEDHSNNEISDADIKKIVKNMILELEFSGFFNSIK